MSRKSIGMTSEDKGKNDARDLYKANPKHDIGELLMSLIRSNPCKSKAAKASYERGAEEYLADRRARDTRWEIYGDRFYQIFPDRKDW